MAVVLSVLAHLVVLAALLASFRRKEGPEELPPPSPVSMVFQSGTPTQPKVPHPSPQATPVQPAPPAPAPPQARPSPPPPVPQQQQAPPAPQPPVKTEAPPLPPPRVVPAPQAAAPTVTLPVPTPPLAPPVPRLEVPPPPAPAQPTPRSAARARPSTAFPPPMDYSFGPSIEALQRPRSMPRPRGGIDLSLGPAEKGALDVTPFGPHAHDPGIADWANALHQWAVEHAYYPREAVQEDQQGDSTVHVTMQPDGKVTRVELVGRSGSVWLDAALLAMFRDQRIPPLPSGENQPFEFSFTIHYILLRR